MACAHRPRGQLNDRRTLRGIDQQVAKAENAVAGKTPVKRDRYVLLTGASKSDQVISTYSQPLNVEKSLRMSKFDLAARPIYHHTRESIEAHLTVVFAALAVSRWIDNTTGWFVRKFVTTARRYRIITITIRAGDRTITAADPLPRRPANRPRSHPRHALNGPIRSLSA